MKIEIINQEPEAQNSLTMNQMLGYDGVYRVAHSKRTNEEDYSDIRIVVHNNSPYYVSLDVQCFEQLIRSQWCSERFIKTDEKIVVTFDDKLSKKSE